uniref:Hydrolase_4 domain-containing protein n=1 Tax=Macrostomum lignano TaxID=282301 RepID=A0A1I8F3D5_9PLAT
LSSACRPPAAAAPRPTCPPSFGWRCRLCPATPGLRPGPGRLPAGRGIRRARSLCSVLPLEALLASSASRPTCVYCRNEPPESRCTSSTTVPLWAAVPDVFLDSGRGRGCTATSSKAAGDSTRLPTLLFLHGNAGNIGHRLPNAALLFHQCRVNLFLLEYRGYGISTGAPSETGLYADAAAALQHLSRRSDIDPQRVLLFGRSLGGAWAIELAAPAGDRRPAQRAWCWRNTFTSLPEAASVLFRLPLLSSLPGLVMTNRFNSRAKMPSVRVPTLFISGLRDTLIPPAMSACLHSLCGSGVRRLETFESGEHNTTWQCAGYFQRLAGFLHFASEMAPQREDWHAGQHSEDEEDQSAGAAAAAASATSAAGELPPEPPQMTFRQLLCCGLCTSGLPTGHLQLGASAATRSHMSSFSCLLGRSSSSCSMLAPRTSFLRIIVLLKLGMRPAQRPRHGDPFLRIEGQQAVQQVQGADRLSIGGTAAARSACP